jgi:ribonuclease G
MRKTLKNKKEILINAGSLESRVAILEEGRLAELHLEREPRVVGNIYKARITTVLPGMEAAFVDIGLEKHAFLSAEETIYDIREPGEAEPPVRQPERKPLGGIAVNQEILVQVNRAAVGAKGARVTTRLALPGRYLVLLLSDPGRVGISRKIESEKARQRLRRLGEELCPSDCGLILRTEAEEARQPQLRKDLDFLLELRKRLFEKASASPAPALVHQDLPLILLIIRDHFNRDVDRLLIDSEEVYKSALELVEMTAPRLTRQVMPYREDTGIFERFGLEEEVGRLSQRRVWLKAGGHISIDQAEALCAIDVNTARFTGKARSGLAQTILRTNLEAASEIARQLRLRDIGGLIVIDFIDMKAPSHRAKVLKAFQEAISRDKAKTRVLSISPLGIVEMTRKKHGESLLEKVSMLCPECGGLGRVPDSLTIALQIQRELRRKAKERPAGALAVWVSSEVANLLVGPEGAQARQLSARLQRPIYIRVRGENSRKYEVALLESGEVEERVGVFHAGQQLTCRRLGEESDLAVSEEGYLVEFQPPSKPSEETFVVELTRTEPYRGVGRLIGAQAAEEEEKRKGIGRRGYRRSRRRKKPAAQEAVPAEKPKIEAPSPPSKPEEKPAEEPAKPEADVKLGRRRRSHWHRKPRQPSPPKSETAQEAPSTSTPAPADTSGRAPRRRRRPRRRTPRSSDSAPPPKQEGSPPA